MKRESVPRRLVLTEKIMTKMSEQTILATRAVRAQKIKMRPTRTLLRSVEMGKITMVMVV
jgi:hypothetical protein